MCGSVIDTANQVISLLVVRKENIRTVIDAIPHKAHFFSKHICHCLIVLLRSAVPTIAGAQGMFRQLQHVMKVAKCRRLKIKAALHGKINLWRHLITSIY